MQVASSTFARTLLPKPAHHSRRLTARSVPGSNGLSGDGCGGTSSLFIGRTVIQGEVVESKDTVVVLGDCQPGSRVCSEQNIIVMGRLLGEVQAGTGGNTAAIVFATDLKPSALRIAGVGATPAQLAQRGSDRKLAMLSGGVIKRVPLARPFVNYGPHQTDLLLAAASDRRIHTASAATFTAAYAMLLGLALAVGPRTVFGVLFDPATVATGFIRLGGVLLAMFGAYYAGAAVGERLGSGLNSFYWSTVWSRWALALVCVALFVSGELPWGILVLGGMNALGAFGMHFALQKDRQVAL